MKNRILILNDLLKMQENNMSLNEMEIKLQHYGLSYYEAINILNEVTHEPLNNLSELLLKDNYWQTMKTKSDEKEEVLKNEYEAMLVIRNQKSQKIDENINETYQNIVQNRKDKEKKLRNLDKHLTEIFQK